MKTATKKPNSTTSANTPKLKQHKGLTKGNGTQASHEPQEGRNKDGKDGAKPAAVPK